MVGVWDVFGVGGWGLGEVGGRQRGRGREGRVDGWNDREVVLEFVEVVRCGGHRCVEGVVQGRV